MRPLKPLRLHARAIVRDGSRAFVGSQSLRRPELNQRREVGVVITNVAVARKLRDIFEADWLESASSKEEKKEDKKLIEAAIITPPETPVVAEFESPNLAGSRERRLHVREDVLRPDVPMEFGLVHQVRRLRQRAAQKQCPSRWRAANRRDPESPAGRSRRSPSCSADAG